MNRLTAKQILTINNKLTQNQTEESTVHDKLNRISQAPYILDKQDFYIYRDTFSKAAKLSCDIYEKKPFKEKNLSTAVLATLLLLQVNNIQLEITHKNLGELSALIKNKSENELNIWLKERSNYKYKTC